MTAITSSPYRQRTRSTGGGITWIRFASCVACCWTLLLAWILVILGPDPDATTIQSNNDNNVTIGSSQQQRILLGGKKLVRQLRSKVQQVELNALHQFKKAKVILQKQRQQEKEYIEKLWEKYTSQPNNLPVRLQNLRQNKQLIGERIAEIRAGLETVQEILYESSNTEYDTVDSANEIQIDNVVSSEPDVIELSEIINFFNTTFVHVYEDAIRTLRGGGHNEKDDDGTKLTPEQIWDMYHNVILNTLYPWENEQYRPNMPRINNKDKNDSIFVSIVSFRDAMLCSTTLENLYTNAKYPDLITVGLIEQNCLHTPCTSGILGNLSTIQLQEPDRSCYTVFCETTDIGKTICAQQKKKRKLKSKSERQQPTQIRTIQYDESLAFGPYMARYIASKLWYGERWYLQIDSHMTFANNWDESLIKMLQLASSDKPIISHTPPTADYDFIKYQKQPTTRSCGPIFAVGPSDEQIIRVEGMGIYDKYQLQLPPSTPFINPGFFIGPSQLLIDVPFDPFLPWIHLGEDILMSTKLWTAGYDIFAPTYAVVGHHYIRTTSLDLPNSSPPRYWESLHRTFGIHQTPGTIQTGIQSLVVQRIKNILGYPEAARDMIYTKTLLTAIEQYNIGYQRSLDSYYRIAGINITTKEITYMEWCEKGQPPPTYLAWESI